MAILASAYSAVQTVTPTLTTWWLKVPGAPTLNLAAYVTGDGAHDLPVAQGVFRPLGRKYPVVVTAERQAEAGSLEVFTPTAAERAALEAVLDDGRTVLVQSPAGESWYAQLGDAKRDRAGSSTQRSFSINWVEVEAP